MIGKVLWDEFFTNRDWPVASAVAVAMLVLLVLPMGLLRRYPDGASAHERRRLSPFLHRDDGARLRLPLRADRRR